MAACTEARVSHSQGSLFSNLCATFFLGHLFPMRAHLTVVRTILSVRSETCVWMLTGTNPCRFGETLLAVRSGAIP